MKIREFRDEDVPEIVSVFNNSFRTNLVYLKRDVESWKWRYLEYPNFKKDGVILAEEDGRIVGCVIVTISHAVFDRRRRIGLVDDVAVIPKFRRRGIARMMMENAIEFMRNEDCELSLLCTDPMGVARKLYESLGYMDAHAFSVYFRPLSPVSILRENPFMFPLALPALAWSAFRGKGIKGKRCSPIQTLHALNSSYSHMVGYHEIDEREWKWRTKGSILISSESCGAVVTPIKWMVMEVEVTFALIKYFYGDPLGWIVRNVRLPFALAVCSPQDVRSSVLRSNGFVKIYHPTLMIRCFTDFRIPRGPWYPPTESIMGIP